MSTNNNRSVLFSFAYAQSQISDIEAIDYFFAKEVISSLPPMKDHHEVFAHTFMLLSAYVRAGHTCINIAEIANTCWGISYDEQGICLHKGYQFPDYTTLLTALNVFEMTNDELLVLHEHNLYMRRYYKFEAELQRNITNKLAGKTSFSTTQISSCINNLFPSEQMVDDDIDWQKIAVANAVNKSFSVIAGGPGTGKTYTVTKLLAALLILDNETSHKEDQLKIALVAPTGKAAQRLSESIISAVAGFADLIDNKILSSIPIQAQTIHRLLGVIPNNPNFKHNEHNPLNYDVLLIDEVSMVDLPMMARVFRATKPTTKVILLGDADQLPSVAVGSVLADIAPRPHHGYTQTNYDYLAKVCNVDTSKLSNEFNTLNGSQCDYLSFLRKSRRFDGEGGIGKIATQVIDGNANSSWQLLAQNTGTSNQKLSQLSLVDSELTQWLLPLVNNYYRDISTCEDINEAFALLNKFRVLCVTRQGEFGVDAINEWISERLSPTQNFSNERTLYHGMPVMITENSYQLGLFNGDIGILWTTKDINKENTSQLMAYFESQNENSEDPEFKKLLPSRLPNFDTVYAMTIHKTQGSEFDHVAIVLPNNIDNPLLSRELLYTGITRAKNLLTIAGKEQTWKKGVNKAVKRYSGLSLNN